MVVLRNLVLMFKWLTVAYSGLVLSSGIRAIALVEKIYRKLNVNLKLPPGRLTRCAC